MKKTLMIATGLVAAASLAACQKQAEAPKSNESETAASSSVPNMPMSTGMMHGKAVGTVTEIDATKGMITLDHGAIAELQWPAMMMGFAVRPELLSGIKVGDKVNFEIDWDGKAGTVTKIEKVGP